MASTNKPQFSYASQSECVRAAVTAYRFSENIEQWLEMIDILGLGHVVPLIAQRKKDGTLGTGFDQKITEVNLAIHSIFRDKQK